MARAGARSRPHSTAQRSRRQSRPWPVRSTSSSGTAARCACGLRPPRTDADVLRFFDELSEQSRYLRFHGFVHPDARLVAPFLDPDWAERGALVGGSSTPARRADRRARDLHAAARRGDGRGRIRRRRRPARARDRHAPARAARGRAPGEPGSRRFVAERARRKPGRARAVHRGGLRARAQHARRRGRAATRARSDRRRTRRASRRATTPRSPPRCARSSAPRRSR